MNQPAPDIASILSDLDLVAEGVSVIAIGAADAKALGASIVQAYETLTGPDDLPGSLKATLAVVVSPLDFMTRRRAVQLLSRLRDVHCNKVVLVDTGSGWDPEELRPLGYLATALPSAGVRCYLYDPDAFSQPREWNNPSAWANPENFRKYRW